MIQNLDTRLNKLQTQCDYYAAKFPPFQKENYPFKKMDLTNAGLSEKRNNLYIVLNQIVLLQRLWP